jgi:hypothetical protein
MRVAVTVEEIILENDGGYDVERGAVTCSRCGETVEIYGTSDASIKRGCVTLHARRTTSTSAKTVDLCRIEHRIADPNSYQI